MIYALFLCNITMELCAPVAAGNVYDTLEQCQQSAVALQTPDLGGLQYRCFGKAVPVWEPQ